MGHVGRPGGWETEMFRDLGLSARLWTVGVPWTRNVALPRDALLQRLGAQVDPWLADRLQLVLPEGKRKPLVGTVGERRMKLYFPLSERGNWNWTAPLLVADIAEESHATCLVSGRLRMKWFWLLVTVPFCFSYTLILGRSGIGFTIFSLAFWLCGFAFVLPSMCRRLVERVDDVLDEIAATEPQIRRP